ncbi:MAG: hypothetical protein U0183_35425 [Polyangiaceae bacterium]
MREALRRALPFALASLVATACSATSTDLGADAELRVTGARLTRGALPADGDGPAVLTLTAAPRVARGTVGAASGSLGRAATGVLVALEGDVGYWTLPASPPDVTAPEAPTFAASIGLSARAKLGTRTLVVMGVDREGRPGARLTRPIIVAPTRLPEGALVVRLTWDEPADLDLRVTGPTGVEVAKDSPPAPDGGASAGVLDVDAFASCAPDGVRTEHIVYRSRPASGRYTARVDTFSLCSAAVAHYEVEAWLDGALVGAARGLSTPYDTRGDHGRGAGALALEIDVP